MTDKSADLPKPDPSEPNTEQIDCLRRLYRDEASTTDGPTTPSASVPRMIGNYKLLENIGEGGMGSVWVADQLQPVKRRVAIKLIKAGMDSKSVLARFEAERQALAMMDHPNIAKVFDGGMTDSGHPYFVMEYVKGVPITEYCDKARLALNERLKLFIPVCLAIQHAHHKGIVHRDLKPSNILVCLYDGMAVPKVIDFGLAKAMHQSLTDKSIYTGHGIMVGTPLYMSPEQAENNNLDVDTRTDIYSLGVVLYELLTGSTPLERQQLQQAAINEVLRLIREVEPPRPSTRLSGSDALPSIAAQRNIEPNTLRKRLSGELDWIVMKALEKERSRRYDTSSGLARDIQRFLDEEPVEACPPSKAYLFRKFVRKNKGKVIAAGTVFAALSIGIIGTTWGLVRARIAEKQAIVAEQKSREAEKSVVEERDKLVSSQRETVSAFELAQRQKNEANDVINILSQTLLQATLLNQPSDSRADITVVDAVEELELMLESNQFAEIASIARIRLILGEFWWVAGFAEKAAQNWGKALATASESGVVFSDVDQLKEACRYGLNFATGLVPVPIESKAVFFYQNAVDDEGFLSDKNLNQLYAAVEEYRNDDDKRVEFWVAKYRLACLHYKNRDYVNCDKVATELFSQLSQRVGQNHSASFLCLELQARSKLGQKNFSEAILYFEKAARAIQYFRDDLAATEAIWCKLRSGLVASKIGDKQTADRIHCEVTSLLLLALKRKPETDLAENAAAIGEQLWKAGQYENATKVYRELLKFYSDESPSSSMVAITTANLGSNLLAAGQVEESIPILVDAAERSLVNSEVLYIWQGLTNAYLKSRTTDRLMQLIDQRTVAINNKTDSDRIAWSTQLIGMGVQMQDSKSDVEAVSIFRSAFAICGALNSGIADVAKCNLLLGISLKRLGKLDEAKIALESGYSSAIAIKHDEELSSLVQSALDCLAAIANEAGSRDELAHWENALRRYLDLKDKE